MDDDLYEHDDSHKDFMVDQRSTERSMQDIYSNGYRDAYQKHSEDEKLLQYGFNCSYKLFVKLGLLIGQIKSICSYSSSVTGKVADWSSFLARVNCKLDRIEKQYNYARLISWNKESKELEPDFRRVIETIEKIEIKLREFKEKVWFFLSGSSNDIQILDGDLNQLDADVELNELAVSADVDESGNLDKKLNMLVQGLNF